MRGTIIDGPKFRQLRLARGLAQRELAISAGVAERTVRNAEAGRRVRLDFLGFLTTALAVDLPELVSHRDELRAALLESRRVEHVALALESHATDQDEREILSLLKSDARIVCHGPEEIPVFGDCIGRDGFRKYLDRCAGSVEYERPLRVDKIRTGGNLVVVEGTDWLKAIPTGRSFAYSWTHIYEFDRDRIARLDMHCDVQRFTQAFLT